MPIAATRVYSSLAPVQVEIITLDTIMGQGVVIEDDATTGYKVIVNKNPATGEVISRVPCTSSTELDAMVEKAVAALPEWTAMETSERIRLLKAGIAALNASHAESLPLLITQEMGKPLAQAQEEMEGVVDKDSLFEILEQTLQPKRHENNLVVRQPIGVVAVLSPWNFPADELLLLVLPALGSGNTGEHTAGFLNLRRDQCYYLITQHWFSHPIIISHCKTIRSGT